MYVTAFGTLTFSNNSVKDFHYDKNHGKYIITQCSSANQVR